MSKIQELRENPDNIINLVNVLALFAPDVKNKTKYIETLVRIFHNDVTIQEETLNKKIQDFGFSQEEVTNLNKVEKIYLTILLNEQENRDAFMKYIEFCLYNEKNAIENNDLQSYKSFKQIFAEHKKAKDKDEQKTLEKQVIKLLDDDRWLVVIPLTYEASLKYGANTKWCTASTEYPTHYESYTKKGILIYCINKKNNDKYAGYCEIKSYGTGKDISFWNAADTKIDGLSCGFSAEVIKIFHDEFKLDDPKSASKMMTVEQFRKKALGTIDANPKKTKTAKSIRDEYATMSGGTATISMPGSEPEPATNEAADYSEIYNTIVEYMGGRGRRNG